MANWNEYPQNEEVRWPRDEKIIGVLGVAPVATADFYQRLCAVPARKDWEHPRVIIDSNPKIPSRGRYLDLGETDPVPFMIRSISDLMRQGAEIIAVPCNTAHILYERYSAPFVDVIIPSIIEITADACLSSRSALVLASRNVVRHGLYDRALRSRGIQAIFPDEAGQTLTGRCIEAAKQCAGKDALKKDMAALIRQSGADCVILGCTELPVLLAGADLGHVSLLDSSQALASRCLELAQPSRNKEVRH